MTPSKESFLERLLRTRNGLEVHARKLPRYRGLVESLNSDLAIFVGGQVMDFIVAHDFDVTDVKGKTEAGCSFSLPPGRERWIQLFSVYSQQRAARSSLLLTRVLVVATIFTTFAAGVQAYCSYKLYRNQQVGQPVK